MPGYPPASSPGVPPSVPHRDQPARASHGPSKRPLPDGAGSPCWLHLTLATGSLLVHLHPGSEHPPCPTSVPLLKLSPVHGPLFLPPQIQGSATLLEPLRWHLLQGDISSCAQSPLPGSPFVVNLDWTVSCLRGPLS